MVSVPVVAPVSGVVVRRSADAGARLAAGAELLAIVPDGNVVFEARLRPDQARAVTIGAPASIDDGAGRSREARVLTRLPAAGLDQAVLVWLRPTSSGGPLDLGRFGTARIRPGGRTRSLAVPDSAIVEDDLTGRHQVAAIDSSGRVVWLEVRPGYRDGALRGVEGPGLLPGRRVIVTGQRALADGAEVDARP